MTKRPASTLFLILLATWAAFAQGTAAPLTIRTQPFLSGLAQPVLLKSAKDGTRRLFVVQQRGKLMVVDADSRTPTTFMDISSKVSQTGTERGFLGVAFHPQFSSNGYFFVNYTRTSDGATVIARYKANSGNLTGDVNSERILLTIAQPFSNHNGGNIEFGPDGNLYIGMGDGGSQNDPSANGQNKNVLLGKMLRITPDVSGNDANPPYTNPADNPYVGVDGSDEIFAIGLRNPWRWSFDRGGTNQLWVGDVGQNVLEEVDVVAKGGNYGWRVYEAETCTNLDPSLCVPGNFTMPRFQYSHSGGRCSVTGGFVYRGIRRTVPDGSYLYADYCTGEVFLWNGTTQTVMLDTTSMLVSFGEDDEGELYIVGLGSTTSATGTVEKLVRAEASADFDGDLKTDIAVYRPSTGMWFVENSSNATYRYQQFGIGEDIPVAEDFDGDNVTDIAVFRPSNGVWYQYRSGDNTFRAFQFGLSGDVPAAGDYDGDRKADFVVYRPSSGIWYMIRSSDGAFTGLQFGLSGDQPTPGDFDGDGKTDVSVFRPSNGVWYRLNSSTGRFAAVQFGIAEDVPSQGDFDGDGRTDQAVFRPSTGVWYIFRSSDGSFRGLQWGLSGDVPVVGDYDADAKADIAVFRPFNGIWYVLRSSNPGSFTRQLGIDSDKPIPFYDRP